MVDTRQFAIEPNKDLLGVDGTLQQNSVLNNRYRISGVVGVGGMGSVYQARDLQFPDVERYVAVKEMLNLSQNRDMREQMKGNFEREANILASLSHPAIPAIYDYFTIKDRAYLVMEYINGKNLEVILSQLDETLPIDMVLGWAIELCDVLDYLHNRPTPIIFRDMKPSNIMIDVNGRLRLIDFGIARVFQQNKKMTMIGTEGYSAPEQYKGSPMPQSDIYALGATLHQVFTNEDPRLHAPFTFADRPIREYNPNVPPMLEAVIMKALAYDPLQRYATAREMKEALETVRRAMQGSVTAAISLGEVPSEAVEEWGSEQTSSKSQLRWKFKVEDEIRSGAAHHEGTLFVGARDHNLWAIYADSGELRWKFATEAPIVTNPDIYREGPTVLIGSDDHHLYSVDIPTGRLHWKLQTKGPVRSSPSVIHGHVFFGSDDGYLYAARMSTGRAAWRYAVEAPIRSQPVVLEDMVIVAAESGDVVALDLSGQFKWRFSAKRTVISTPAIHDGIAYFGSYDYHLYAVDIKNGWSIWRFRAGKPIISSPVVVPEEEIVVFGCADGYIYAVDLFNNRERWKFQTDNQVVASPAYENGNIYIGSVDQNIYCIDAQKGRELWRFQTEGPVTAKPFILDGVMYIGSLDHNLYAIKA
ncbi:MAG: protein kinase [Phototrophicales bacterium]|nr:MAG: protein kinase [Phototrophicales bacterium]